MTYLQKLIERLPSRSVLRIVKSNCPSDFFLMDITEEQCRSQASCHTCWKQKYDGESLKI